MGLPSTVGSGSEGLGADGSSAPLSFWWQVIVFVGFLLIFMAIKKVLQWILGK
jgi:hypothetical protein